MSCRTTTGAGLGARLTAHVGRLAVAAVRALADGLLAALVAGLAVDFIVHALAGRVVAVHLQHPAQPARGLICFSFDNCVKHRCFTR